MMLKINNLYAYKDKTEILKNINLEIDRESTHVIFGPNGSGKSTLAKVIVGIPEYKIKGKIIFEKKDITKLPIEKRARLGIALAFQFPPAIKNVKLADLIEKIRRREVNFKEKTIEKLLNREINVGFSGGEKKISELLQVISMNPKFVVLDEIDSGLDMHKIKKIGKIINEFKKSNNISLLIITHSGEILKYLRPDTAHVMLDGEIVCSSNDWKQVWKTIRRFGYEKCKICRGKLFTNRP